jgi:hypothetical protein
VNPKEPWNILEEPPRRADFLGDADDLPEEPGAGADEPGALTGDAEVLAGEAADKQIAACRPLAPLPAHTRRLTRGPGAGSVAIAENPTHVIPSGDIGPVSGEDAPSEGVKLALPGDGESGALKAKVKAPDAREERADGGHVTRRTREAFA